MDLLSDSGVLESDIVANSTMNRGRGLTGVNSYSHELDIDIISWLVDRARRKGSAFWYDACCGEGEALFEAQARLAKISGVGNISVIGADLVGAAK